MKEILGGELEQVFKDLHINVKKTFQSKIKKNDYNQIWELSDEDYETLCSIKDEDWKDGWSWWQYAEGSNVEDSPTCHMKINGKDILAYYDRENIKMYLEDFLESAYIAEFKTEEKARERLIKDYFDEECIYGNLTNYCCEQWGASMERNVCAITVSLAKLNNMTLGELFTLYQG